MIITRLGRGVLALGLAMAGPVLVAPQAAHASRETSAITIQVVDVSPSTPVPSNVKRPLVISMELTNNTGRAINGVQVQAQRGDPIGNQQALDAALKTSTPPEGGYDIAPTTPDSVDLPAGATNVPTRFVTSTDIPRDAGICLCHDAIYPLQMSAHVTGTDGVDQTLGFATTYMPSFKAVPKPVQVSWVWPLIDRPHRLLDDTVFTDDELAASVTDGRLDRALRVVEGVEAAKPAVPLTLVIDPELLDELEVMAGGKYTVQSATTRKDSSGKTVPVEAVPGTGSAAAESWLVRLRAVVDLDQVQVELTPYADPDVESLAAADLPWARNLANQTMAARVATALGGRSYSDDVAWPAAGVVSRTGLESLATAGAQTLILDSAAVRPNLEGDIPRSFATLRTRSSSIQAALTAPALQSYVRSAVTVGGAGTGALPQLTAELAVRRDEDLSADRFVLLTPPRYVDASVANAVRTIRDTSISPFTTPIALRSASPSGDQKVTSRLVATNALQTGLSNETLSNINTATTELPTAEQLLADAPTAQALRATYEPALQRVSSAAWRVDSTIGLQSASAAQSGELYKRLEAIFAAVYIVKPTSGSYTLASSNSPLPITVENDSNFGVKVVIDVRTAGGLPGFTADNASSPVIAPHTKQLVHIRTHVERSGRIPVLAQLRTTDGASLGDPITLSVHSTVLGTVGVVITIVAGAILGIALLLRLSRQWRTRRTRPSGPTRATKRHLVDSQPELAQ
ncbi:MAG TPA: DUF6049 family protein [Jatrophihabitans sp.]|uniref:DUF6049 family protein n=1 Tax=Jatrophihabitans sp. TaxID=1932789 RepID=UPI002E006B6D|nr:DUF6049 family protein [Jatrophihabitans sp.]